MGSGMAHCLLRAGYPLRVWNRNAAKMAAFEAAGAVACASPLEAIKGTQIVFSSLMDDASIRAVFGGPEGVIAHLPPHVIHVCVTTISASCADWLAEQHQAHGSRYVSGPVIGRPDAAAEGSLVQLLAGDASAIAEVEPISKAFASMVLPMAGPASVANSQKLCANFFIISLIEVMAECLTFAEKTGASAEMMTQFFDRSFALPGLKGYAQRLFARNTDGSGGFGMRGGLKDVRLMLAAAKRADCPLDLAALIEGKMEECLARGLENADWSAIQEVTRARAGLTAK